MHAVSNPIIQTINRDGLFPISYSISIDPIIVSVTILKIDYNFNELELGLFVQGHPRSKVMVPIGSALVVFI